MAKAKKAYVCTECGGEHTKWQGQCDDCSAWNTLKELVLESPTSGGKALFQGYAGAVSANSRIQVLGDIDLKALPRLSTGVGELDRVLGGGLVHGSAILIGGHPGAGKSTLLLEIMCQLAAQYPALYVTGEESLQQVAMRAQRLGLPMDKLQLLAETNVQEITRLAGQHHLNGVHD